MNKFKILMSLLLFFVVLSCSKEVVQPNQTAAKGGGKGRPPKDTIVVTPPDTTVVTPPDTVIVTPPDTVVNPGPNHPKTFMLSMPTAINQGSEGPCVSVALVYAHTLLTGQLMSPEWLYNNTKVGSCASGSSIITALNFMYNKGGKTWQEVPYDDKNGCEALPGEGTHKISGWSTIRATDTTAIKSALLSGKALPFTYTLDHAVWTNQLWTNVVFPVYGPHASTIVGYDEEAFIFMNTYGPTFGTNGTNRVSKAAFSKMAYEVFVLR